MQNDLQVLTQLNVQIGEAESQGDHNWLASILAPKLAFQRTDGKTIDDRKDFLDKVTPTDPRETKVESIDLYGDRAIVQCIVTMKATSGDKRFHNLRLFIRYEEKWKLLGWANELM